MIYSSADDYYTLLIKMISKQLDWYTLGKDNQTFITETISMGKWVQRCLAKLK